jgi:hypothetical protein
MSEVWVHGIMIRTRRGLLRRRHDAATGIVQASVVSNSS